MVRHELRFSFPTKGICSDGDDLRAVGRWQKQQTISCKKLGIHFFVDWVVTTKRGLILVI